MTRRVRFFSPADRLSMLVLASFFAVTMARDAHALATTALIALVALLLTAIAAWGRRSPFGGAAHTFLSPYASVALLFELSSRIVSAVHAPRWDARLALADERLFGAFADAWRGALGRPAWLTDLAGACYVSFYAFPLVVGLAIFLGRTRRDFETFTFTTETAFFLPYVGYVAMPASGPRDLVTLGGAHVAQVTHAFVASVELNDFDAFPSGHTAVALVVAALGARAFPKWGAAFFAVAGAIVFSTVYLAYHYVIDVVAGACVAASMPFVVPALERICGVTARNPFALGARAR